MVRAAGYGLYALLDMHQDALSARMCGEGLPDWAIRTGSGFHFFFHCKTIPLKYTLTLIADAAGFPFPFEKDPYPIDPQTGHPFPKVWG